MKWPMSVSCAATLAWAMSFHALAVSTPCEGLSSVNLPHATITAARTVAAGAFTPSVGGGDGEGFKKLPSFCRIAATLRPSADSDIKIEVWLPVSGWNGKFQAVGNGGWAGTISYPAMSRALEHGYATSSTDTGHAGASAAFALGHPEKLIDYAYRSEHEMTVNAKALIEAFYGNEPSRSYWNGCSTGGRQALMEAQRFPDDFDGIIAGAAANPKTHLDAWRIWMAQAMFKDQASVIPVSKFAMIHEAVLAACDATDGLKDGLIQDPKVPLRSACDRVQGR
jgi:feruloyl esterase